MNENTTPTTLAATSGLMGSYVKLISAVLIGVALGVGLFFLIGGGNLDGAGNQGNAQGTSSRLCVCPQCGTVIDKPAGIDCEEVNCPNCGQPMGNGAVLAAAGAGAMTQNQRETLAERGVPTAGAMTQNQRETLAEQAAPLLPPLLPTNQQPLAAAFQQPGVADGRCVCPVCGTITDRPAGVSCEALACPRCQTPMTNSIIVGRRQDLNLAALGGAIGQPAPVAAAAQTPCPYQAAPAPSPVAAQAPCPVAAQAPCPVATQAPCPNQGAAPPPGNLGVQGALGITYSNTVQGIVARNCLRCHGGPMRSLTTYAELKAYADNGLLRMMTQPGGPMSRFLTADEAHQIDSWIKNGAQP